MSVSYKVAVRSNVLTTGLKELRAMIFLSFDSRDVDAGLGNEISLKYGLGKRRGTLAIKCFLSRTFLEWWASNPSSTTQSTAKLPSATRMRCLHALSPVLDGPPCLFGCW